MPDQPSNREPDRPRRPNRWPPNWVSEGPPRTPAPRWVKVFGIAGVLVVVLVVVMLLAGHGPGRHLHGLPGHATPAGGFPERV